MQNLISAEVIHQCRLKDRKAQRTVYEKLFTPSMKVCRRYCRNSEDAMEVLNSGFLSVFTQIDQYNGKGSFEGWVHRIMVNKALDHVRTEKKKNEYFTLSEHLDDFPEEETTEEIDIQSVDIESLYNMIGELPPASRMVFNLYVFEEFSHNEIAKTMGISAGTSKWHLSNARRILKNKVSSIYIKSQ